MSSKKIKFQYDPSQDDVNQTDIVSIDLVHKNAKKDVKVNKDRILDKANQLKLYQVKVEYDPSQNDMNQTDIVSSSKDLAQEIAEGAKETIKVITEKANNSPSCSTFPKCIYFDSWGTQNCCDKEPKFDAERECSCLMKTLCIGTCLGVTGYTLWKCFQK